MGGTVRERLKRLRLKPEKGRGQNFLIDAAAVDQIVSFGRPQAGERLVEIGPGLGALTQELAALAPLTVIEVEPQFCRELRSRFPAIQVIEEDVRLVDFADLGYGLVVFGNLPYALSTDIVFHLLAQGSTIKRAVLLLQKEFVERLGAAPGGRDYGVLSISAQLKAEILMGPQIGGDCFHPPTQVDSLLVELRFRPQPLYSITDDFAFKRVVAAAFYKRRKKILNSIVASGLADSAAVAAALAAADLDPNARAETLAIGDFVQLAEALAPACRS